MKYSAESYKGRSIGAGGYNYRIGVQIVATENGRRKYVFRPQGPSGYRTPCLKIWEGVAHYKTSLNKADQAEFVKAMEEAKKLAISLNLEGLADGTEVELKKYKSVMSL